MALTYTRKRLSTTDREKLYDRCRGANPLPICNICKLPVDGTSQAWDESHDPDGPPHAMNGNNDTGVAHRDCNRRHGAQVVVPLMAKVDRVRQGFMGAFRSRAPMPCGRDSNRSAAIGGGVKPRMSLADFHRTSSKIFRREPPAEPLADLTDGLMQGDLPEDVFANLAAALDIPAEEIGDLILLSRVSTEMRQ